MTDDSIDYSDLGFNTRAIRTGHQRTAEGEHGEPIFPTSSFVFDSAAQAAARFGGEEPGNIYSRFTNPTVRNFEQRLASLEAGERAVATSSGMAAILATFMGLLKAGDHVVSSRSIFGTSVILFNNYLGKFGVETTFVPLTDLSAWEKAIRAETKLLFLETPSNPLAEVADITALAELAHARGCLLVVDNCFCTPALQQPLKLGADIIVHSATKYLDGQGRCIGGAVVGAADVGGKHVYGFLRTCGPTMSPFNAWVFLKGLETLKLRMETHSKSALALAQWPQRQASVKKAHYTGLESHPQHALASKQQSAHAGVLSFQVNASKEAASKLTDATPLLSITANLRHPKTTTTHPATTTHGRLKPEERAAAGISDGLSRVAVGLEEVEDIIADLERGLINTG